MIKIPAIRSIYDEAVIRKLSPVEGMAAILGVPPQFLNLANWPDAKDYSIHAFRSFYTPQLADEVKYEEKQKSIAPEKRDKKKADKPVFEKVAITPAFQRCALIDLLDGPLFHDFSGTDDNRCLIVVNSYPSFFAAADRGSGEMFLWHLACSVAAKRMATRDQALNFAYLGSTETIEQSKWEQPKPKTVFAFGPVTDDFVSYQYTNAISFLTTYAQHTRILLLSVKDITETLERLRIDIGYPDYLFQLGSDERTPLKKLPRWSGYTPKATPPAIQTLE